MSDAFTDGDPVEESLLRVVSHLIWRMRSGRQHELSPPMLRVLNRLLREGPIPMSAVADTMDVSRPTATTIVDRMEDEGLVRRERGPHDGRQINVRLTAEGDRIGTAAHRRSLERAAMILARLENEQLQTVHEALRILETALRDPALLAMGDDG